MLVQLNDTAHHATIILKMGVPIRVGEHDIRSAVRAMLIRGVEETAKIRLNAQYVEIVSADVIEPSAGRIVARVERRRPDGESCESIKAAVAVAQVEIVRVRFEGRLIACALDFVEALRFGNVQRAQDQSV